jgi:hypothetical protein
LIPSPEISALNLPAHGFVAPGSKMASCLQATPSAGLRSVDQPDLDPPHTLPMVR